MGPGFRRNDDGSSLRQILQQQIQRLAANTCIFANRSLLPVSSVMTSPCGLATAMQLWPAAKRESLPVAMMGGLFLPKFREIAERHPHLRMILDHCGLNRHGQHAEAFIHLDELVALSKLPNVAVKATGAPHYSTHPNLARLWIFVRRRPRLDQCLPRESSVIAAH
jgi:hypothetical protein